MSWFSDLFLPKGAPTAAEQEANYKAQQAKFAAQRAAKLEQGMITQEQYDRDMQLATDYLPSQDYAAAVGALEGATEIFYDPGQWAADTQEGAKIVGTAAAEAVGVTSSALWTITKQILGAIPWWIWILLAGGLFLWMGGLELLRGKLAKHA